jgi:hypothetical protein
MSVRWGRFFIAWVAVGVALAVGGYLTSARRTDVPIAFAFLGLEFAFWAGAISAFALLLVRPGKVPPWVAGAACGFASAVVFIAGYDLLLARAGPGVTLPLAFDVVAAVLAAVVCGLAAGARSANAAA